ncbi:MAG: RnfABCDGE type electron transport complex subunit D [Candidatus Omnitrophica bacterium]|jgi:electron transport complex protein RnfD|nr:RnfABCDGE type electron transport complex subunit D [Candidatus Omnitrophota bacterium]
MQLTISASPHLNSKIDTPFLMRQVVIALLPAVIASVFFFKHHALSLIVNCIISAVLTEIIILKIRNKPIVITDFSSIVTGLLLALILPPTTAWYAASLGSIFSIFIGKHLFGGLGYNIFNPALLGRAFLMAAYPKMLTTFIEPFSVDVISSATPLALKKFSHITTPTLKLFLGNVSGSLGETSAICLIIGGIYLLIRKIADWRIPLSLFLTVTIISTVTYIFEPEAGPLLFHLFSGGLLLGGFFMATDPVTTPVTKVGRYIYGISCGILIMVIRYLGGLPEGVMYSILFMNACVPLLNKYTKPKRYGT